MRGQAIVTFLLTAWTSVFLVGCIPFSTLTTTKVTNLSGEMPYKTFVGKYIKSKEDLSLWHHGSEFSFVDNFVKEGNGGDIPSYETGFAKIADLPIGTQFRIHSIKHKKVTTEMSGYDGTQALCTVQLTDGRRVACQLDWQFLNPDPHVSPTPKFEIVER